MTIFISVFTALGGITRFLVIPKQALCGMTKNLVMPVSWYYQISGHMTSFDDCMIILSIFGCILDIDCVD